MNEFDELAKAMAGLRDRYAQVINQAPADDRQTLALVASHCLARVSAEVFSCDQTLLRCQVRYEEDLRNRTQ